MKRMLPMVLVMVTFLGGCDDDQPQGGASRSPAPTVGDADGSEFPGPVAEIRAGILEAAEEHDYELLRPLLDPDAFLSDFGFGREEVPDPIARWEEMGEQPLEVMAALLNMDSEEDDTNEGHLFRWPPYDPETGSMAEIDPADREAFLSVMSRKKLRSLVSGDYGYIGPRLGILADGTWWFFLLEPGP